MDLNELGVGAVVVNDQGHSVVLADPDGLVPDVGAWWNRTECTWVQTPGVVVEVLSVGVDGRG